METSTLIKKVHMDCPLCGKTHEVEERKRFATLIVKGEEVTYEERFYFCANADENENEFETGTMTNTNLLNARNAYRVKRGLLTSDEIVAIRENYGLSQVDLARLLGWGEATISRYESKAIQDEAYDTMLRLIKDNPLIALEFLKKNASKFTAPKRVEIRAKIVENLDSYGKEYDYLNNLTYIVECKADIEYKTFNRDLGTTFPHWEQVHERESFYGVSWSSKTITFDINFWHFEPVIQVFPSSLSCRIINAY